MYTLYSGYTITDLSRFLIKELKMNDHIVTIPSVTRLLSPSFRALLPAAYLEVGVA